MTTERDGARHERLREIGAAMEAALGERLAREPSRLSSGASRETFALATAGGRELILQTERGGKLSGATPPQAPLLKAARVAGVPVPAVVADGRDDPVLGAAWTLVEALPGTSDPRTILAGDGVAASETLLDQIAAALAAIHRMPADPALAPAVEDPIELLRDMYEGLGEPHATFELAFRALGERPPSRDARTFVHGDFRMGNLMVGAKGLTGVLDWELAHVGDPLEDLGWLCVPAWRFTRRDRPAAGLSGRDELLSAYGRHSGRKVDRAALAWWELAGTLRWGVICVMQAFVHLSGAAHSVEHAVIGRRACEVEWDLLDRLDAREREREGDGAAAQPEPEPEELDRPNAQPDHDPPGEASLHDRPTAAELLAAARTTLAEEIVPALDGREEFQLRVTMRALGIVARELEHAPSHRRVHAQALQGLGARDERELATMIADGALDGRQREVREALRSIVRAKLEVANPRYLRPTQRPPTTEES